MKGSRCGRALIGLAAAAMLPANAAAQEAAAVLLRGTLDLARDRVDLAGARIKVNGIPAALAADGQYAVQLPQSAYYQVAIEGPQLFTMVQTFGTMELRDAECSCLKVPPIDPVARRKGRVEMFFGGDTMAGRRYFEPGYRKPRLVAKATIDRDLAGLLRSMQPYFASSDLASVNLETVLADQPVGPSPPKRIVFYSPTALARALKTAGIDFVSLGNNHTYDYLDRGLENTTAALDQAGVIHSGAGRDVASASAAARFDIGGNRIAMLGYVGWAGRFSPNMVAGPGKGGAMHGNEENIAQALDRERVAGHVPVVQLHTGTEYGDEPTEFAIKRMRFAIDKGAALVASHHPHVPQGLERYGDGLIAYSLGNFMFDQDFIETMATFAMKAWFEEGKLIRAEVIPIHILDYRPVPAVGSVREALLRRIFALSARRNTYLRMSGGHAVVRLDDGGEPGKADDCKTGATGAERNGFRLSAPLAACLPDDAGTTGRDLLMRGDFENVRYDAALDRTWRTHQAHWETGREPGGNQYLTLRPQAAGKPSVLFADPYFRNRSGTRYSLLADVRTQHAASIELAVKDRREGGAAGLKAWQGGSVAGKADVPAALGWQRIRIDFTRVAAAQGAEPVPFRPVITVNYKDGKAAGTTPIAFDNMAVVEWEDRPARALPKGDRWLWSHRQEKQIADR